MTVILRWSCKAWKRKRGGFSYMNFELDSRNWISNLASSFSCRLHSIRLRTLGQFSLHPSGESDPIMRMIILFCSNSETGKQRRKLRVIQVFNFTSYHPHPGWRHALTESFSYLKFTELKIERRSERTRFGWRYRNQEVRRRGSSCDRRHEETIAVHDDSWMMIDDEPHDEVNSRWKEWQRENRNWNEIKSTWIKKHSFNSSSCCSGWKDKQETPFLLLPFDHPSVQIPRRSWVKSENEWVRRNLE